MNTKVVSMLKGVFGLFALQNLGRAFSFIDSTASSQVRNTSIVNIVLGLVFLYFAFKLEPLMQRNPRLVKAMVWIALIFTIIIGLWSGTAVMWLVFYVAVGIYLLVNLYKATKSEQLPIPPVVH